MAESGMLPRWLSGSGVPLLATVLRYSPPDAGFRYRAPASWSFAQPSSPQYVGGQLDLAILRLTPPCTIAELNLSAASPARALSLGDSASAGDGEPLVMLGFGQAAGSGGAEEGTSTTTRGIAAGTFYTLATGSERNTFPNK